MTIRGIPDYRDFCPDSKLFEQLKQAMDARMSTINADRLNTFGVTYRRCLTEAITANPDDYPWAKGALTIDTVHQRMMQAIVDGSYNKDGDGFRRTCKALGIKHTYTSINAYLQGN